MANEIIYGCVEEDMTITFEQGTCEYISPNACYHETGLHAGMIAVTINTQYCDDTYYGCVDWSNNGKFQVSVPGECCWYCEGCWESYGEQPEIYYGKIICSHCPEECPPLSGEPCCGSTIFCTFLKWGTCTYRSELFELECGQCGGFAYVMAALEFYYNDGGDYKTCAAVLSRGSDWISVCENPECQTSVGSIIAVNESMAYCRVTVMWSLSPF